MTALTQYLFVLQWCKVKCFLTSETSVKHSSRRRVFHRFRVKKQDFTPKQDITFFALHSWALKFLQFHIKFPYEQGKFKNWHVSQMFQMICFLVKLPLMVGIPLNHLAIRPMPILLWHGTFVCFNLCEIIFQLKQYKAINIIYLHYS